ncbi:hypothetical protein DK846_06145 [Methanospirillum lacunae]|uniref:Uncharacterized protein n=1 Tax=Methanospirillum lacunae TaxID=668570 RepID=A0A2V2N8E7_9EURY|nr:hypothetical protein DK846_06145 [Methanospirillum lacunae]
MDQTNHHSTDRIYSPETSPGFPLSSTRTILHTLINPLKYPLNSRHCQKNSLSIHPGNHSDRSDSPHEIRHPDYLSPQSANPGQVPHPRTISPEGSSIIQKRTPNPVNRGELIPEPSPVLPFSSPGLCGIP